jgi:REP element-mobilizing transposase RayT
MKMQRKILDQNGLNFLTFTVVSWIDLFSRSCYCDVVVDSLRFCQKNKGLKVFAYVVMSNHMHLIVQTEEYPGLSSIVQSFKAHTSRTILKLILDDDVKESRRDWMLSHFSFQSRKNKRKGEYQIWKRGSYPTLLYSPKVIRQKLDYIHLNPVKAKIVVRPEDYWYSSANWYQQQEGPLEVTMLDGIWDDKGFVFMGYPDE